MIGIATLGIGASMIMGAVALSNNNQPIKQDTIDNLDNKLMEKNNLLKVELQKTNDNFKEYRRNIQIFIPKKIEENKVAIVN